MIKFTSHLVVATTYALSQEYTQKANQVELLPNQEEDLPPTCETDEQECRPIQLTDIFPPALFSAIAVMENQK
jgi:hypothetical protein